MGGSKGGRAVRKGRSASPASNAKSGANREPTGNFGHYQLLAQLGRGGMGAVYKARHARLNRIDALKVLSREWRPAPGAVERFEREMAIIGVIQHKHIVHAYDAGEIEGTLYLAMEYIDGFSAGEIVKRCGPLTLADSCAIAHGIALALECVHEHGMVHRDVKPSNIMVGCDGVTKLVDLGLARLMDPMPLANDDLTQTGQLMGTPDYMAPEQATDSRFVDIRSDLYSLGCTLYQFLTGHAPFSEYSSILQKAIAQVQKSPPPIREVRAEVPEALAAIIERLLAKSPSDRYHTPQELAEALEPFTAGSDLRELVWRTSKIPGENPDDKTPAITANLRALPLTGTAPSSRPPAERGKKS